MQEQYLTYLYLLTALHTGGSSQAGNLVGIAREVPTDLPYLTASSIRGKLRAGLESQDAMLAGALFGQRLDPKQGTQPTEGGLWFADATLLFFPVASYSHQFLWVSCPLWLSRWNRWLRDPAFESEVAGWKAQFQEDHPQAKSAFTSVPGGNQGIYVRGAVLQPGDVQDIAADSRLKHWVQQIPTGDGILDLGRKLVILADESCAALVEMGLQREVRIMLEQDSKTAKDGSFRSEEAIPSETVMFFPWGAKSAQVASVASAVKVALGFEGSQRLQFGGLEGLGRGWAELRTLSLSAVDEAAVLAESVT